MSCGQVIVPSMMVGSMVLSTMVAPEGQSTDVPLMLKVSTPPVQ